MSKESATSLRTSYKSYLNDQLSSVDSYVPKASMLEKQWKGLVWPASPEAIPDPETGVERPVLAEVGRASTVVPEGFVRIASQRYVCSCS